MSVPTFAAFSPFAHEERAASPAVVRAFDVPRAAVGAAAALQIGGYETLLSAPVAILLGRVETRCDWAYAAM